MHVRAKHLPGRASCLSVKLYIGNHSTFTKTTIANLVYEQARVKMYVLRSSYPGILEQLLVLTLD